MLERSRRSRRRRRRRGRGSGSATCRTSRPRAPPRPLDERSAYGSSWSPGVVRSTKVRTPWSTAGRPSRGRGRRRCRRGTRRRGADPGSHPPRVHERRRAATGRRRRRAGRRRRTGHAASAAIRSRGGDLSRHARRDARRAPPGPGELAGDGGGGVGVVAEVGGAQHGVAEVVGAAHRPQRGLERVDAVAGAPDLGRLLGPSTTRRRRASTSGCSSPHCQKLGAEHLVDARPCRSAPRPSRPSAGRRRPAAERHGWCGSTRPSARPPRPTSACQRIGTAASRISDPFAADSSSGSGSTASPVRSEPLELLRCGDADVEAPPGRGQVAVVVHST